MPDSNATPTDVLVCATEQEAMSCIEYYSSGAHLIYHADCLPPGDRENGEPCNSPAQCASGHCVGLSTSCGVCGEFAQIGDACGSNDCDPSHSICRPDGMGNTVCTETAQLGEPCNNDSALGPIVPCLGGSLPYNLSVVCVEGICQAEAREGEACVTSDEEGWSTCAHGYFCSLDTGSCQQRVAVAPGEVCGGVELSCRAGDCRYDSEPEQSLCIGRSAARSSCDNDLRGCRVGLYCDENRRCVLPPRMLCEE